MKEEILKLIVETEALMKTLEKEHAEWDLDFYEGQIIAYKT